MYERCDTLARFHVSAIKHIVLKPQRHFYAFHDKLPGIKSSAFLYVSMHNISGYSNDKEHSNLFIHRNEIFDTKEKNLLHSILFLEVG